MTEGQKLNQKSEIEARAVAYIDKVIKRNVSGGMSPPTPEERSSAILAAIQIAVMSLPLSSD